jgi:hypothetical protein
MAITAPVSLTKIKTEFTKPLIISTSTFTSGSGTVTAPVGATSVTIQVWGGGGGGGSGQTRSGIGDAGGGGGGGGGYVSHTVSVTAGVTQFNYSVGAGGAGYIGEAPVGENEIADSGNSSTVTSSSPNVSLSAGGGAGGECAFFDGGSIVEPGAGGARGTASGGTINSSGLFGNPSLGVAGGDGGVAGGIGGGSGGVGGGAFDGQGGNGGIPGGGGGGGGTDSINDNGGNGARGEIRFEWTGETASDKLSDYVRGGTYVPNYPANSAISTTVAGLAISQFLGASNTPVVTLPTDWNPVSGFDISVGFSEFDTTESGASAQCQLIFYTDGTMKGRGLEAGGLCGNITATAFYEFIHTWLNSGSASDYYVRFDITGGDTPSGDAVNSNVQLNATRYWYLCVDLPGVGYDSATATGTLSIRDASNNILASKTIQLIVVASSTD